MMNTNKKTPKLRFKGFTDDWEQRKFKDIAFKRGKISEADLPYVEFEDINSGIGTLNKNISQKVGHKKGLLFEAGDVLFGKLRPYLQNWLLCQFAGIAVGDFWVLQPQNVSSAFLYYLIQSEAYQSVANISSGTKMPRSSWPLVSETLFSIPKYKEANMIGEFFLLIDRTITLHQCKLEKLKLNKSALLQKLFPQNGCTIPEIRFKEFTGAWEQRKFSDLYEKISEKNDLSYSLDKIISVANMYYKSDAKVSNEEYLKTYNIFRYGEIAFEGNKSKDFAYGRFVENTIGDGIISHVFEVFRPIAKYDIYFWKYYINYEPIMGKILSRCTKKTTMMTNLVAKDFLKETVLVPTLAEQKQIGTLLNAIDKFITLHQRKLDRLISIKKGLLQQLFV